MTVKIYYRIAIPAGPYVTAPPGSAAPGDSLNISCGVYGALPQPTLTWWVELTLEISRGVEKRWKISPWEPECIKSDHQSCHENMLWRYVNKSPVGLLPSASAPRPPGFPVAVASVSNNSATGTLDTALALSLTLQTQHFHVSYSQPVNRLFLLFGERCIVAFDSCN